MCDFKTEKKYLHEIKTWRKTDLAYFIDRELSRTIVDRFFIVPELNLLFKSRTKVLFRTTQHKSTTSINLVLVLSYSNLFIRLRKTLEIMLTTTFQQQQQQNVVIRFVLFMIVPGINISPRLYRLHIIRFLCIFTFLYSL